MLDDLKSVILHALRVLLLSLPLSGLLASQRDEAAILNS